MGILSPFGNIRKGSIFYIPDYQRSYSWEDKQIEDLVEDVKTALDEDIKHYLGQITLSKKERVKNYTFFEIIDGQQRITSLILLFLAFENVYEEARNYLVVDDYEVEKYLWNEYGVDDNLKEIPILIPSEINRNTFFEVSNRDYINTKNKELKTNYYLKKSFKRFEGFVQSSNIGEEEFWKLDQDLLMVDFDIEEENLIHEEHTATKIFLSLNDRGKPLSILERLKALFMYYDMKDIDGDLQQKINNNFAEIYKHYDYIISQEEISSNLRFQEKTLLNYYYHYIWKYINSKYSLDIPYHFDKNPEDIYSDIRKSLAKKLPSESLKEFIKEFVENFSGFSNAFKDIIYQEENKKLQRIIHLLPLSARPYPLLIGLWIQDYLTDENLSIIEKIDMFIYKARGTDPRADLYRKVISELMYLRKDPEKPKEIQEQMKKFLNRFKDSCEERHVQLTKYILWLYNKKQYGDDCNILNFTLYEDLEIEHILAIDDEEDVFQAFGFETFEEYRELKDIIGNLTILQSDLNKIASDKMPAEKADIYRGFEIEDYKILEINRNLGVKISDQFNGTYEKKHIQERTKEILDFVRNEWSIEF